MDKELKIAAILPCYKAKQHVLDVIKQFGPEVSKIICVDDGCPDQTGIFIQENCSDARLEVIFLEKNAGVGGATMAGMIAASKTHDILVKVDSDGQMDPKLIPALIQPIEMRDADFTKGNRFFNPADVRAMPKVRLFGNAGLSFLTKLSSGYWTMFDPTNGFLAIHASIFRRLPHDKIANRYFFESDLLFRAGLQRARVQDMPMKAIYADETSHLKISKVLFDFSFRHMKNFIKRIFYNYFLRDFSPGSLYLLLGMMLTSTGMIAGLVYLLDSMLGGNTASPGEVMFAALPLFVGIQFGIAFLTYDIESSPKTTLWPSLQAIDNL